VGETTTNLGEVAHAGPSIPTTTGLYPGQPYPGVANPLWGQPNPVGIPQQGTFPNQSVNPMIPTQQPPQTQYMGGPWANRNTWGDHQVNHSTWEDHRVNHNTWGTLRSTTIHGGSTTIHGRTIWFFHPVTTYIWSYWCSYVTWLLPVSTG
jgi:hypothetical protein